MNKMNKKGKTMKKAELQVRTQLTATEAKGQGGLGDWNVRLTTRLFEEGTVFDVLNDKWTQWTLRADDGTEWCCNHRRLQVVK
jgi:hypothetical protein